LHNLSGIKEQTIIFSGFLLFTILGSSSCTSSLGWNFRSNQATFFAATVHEAREKAPLVIHASSTHTTLSARLLNVPSIDTSTLLQIIIIMVKRE
jgi:hypothetical protein